MSSLFCTRRIGKIACTLPGNEKLIYGTLGSTYLTTRLQILTVTDRATASRRQLARSKAERFLCLPGITYVSRVGCHRTFRAFPSSSHRVFLASAGRLWPSEDFTIAFYCTTQEYIFGFLGMMLGRRKLVLASTKYSYNHGVEWPLWLLLVPTSSPLSSDFFAVCRCFSSP